MRGRRSKKIEQIEKVDEGIDNDLQILAEAIHPKKLTKELKDAIIKDSTTQPQVTFFFDSNEKKFMNSKYGRQFSLLPILLYLVFTKKKISVNIKCSQYYSRDPTMTQTNTNLQTNLSAQDDLQKKSQEIVNQFLKQQKFKNLLKLIDEKMNIYQQQASRKMPNKPGKIDFQYIRLLTSEHSIIRLNKVLNFFGIFYTIFARLIQRYSIIINKMDLRIQMKQVEEIVENENSLLQKFIEKIGWHFWKFILQIRSVVFIEVYTEKLRKLFSPLSVLVQKAILSQIEKKENQNLTQDELLTEILRGYFRENKNSRKDEVIDPDYLIPFLKMTPHLKVLNVVLGNYHELRRIENSYKLFKTVSQSNKLIENLTFQYAELSFEEKIHEKGSIIDQNKQEIENQQSELDRIDENLFWLQRMQESCPYLSGVKLQFSRKSQDEERRLNQEQRSKYMQKIGKSSQILNVFYTRGINNQTFFNTIKALKSEGFDYETILGVLDKKNPFCPL